MFEIERLTCLDHLREAAVSTRGNDFAWIERDGCAAVRAANLLYDAQALTPFGYLGLSLSCVFLLKDVSVRKVKYQLYETTLRQCLGRARSLFACGEIV